MKKMKVAELVLDFDLYPRNNVDSHNVRNLVDALATGAELPPVVIDKKTKRVTDGFHRCRASLQHFGDDAEILVIEKAYKSDAEMFVDAMKYNASHGAKLDSCDRSHCLIVAERLKIAVSTVAEALHMSVDRLSTLRETRTGINSSGQAVALKNTIAAQFTGKRLNKRQVQANEKLSGMSQVFYANQLIELLESDMLDTENEKLMERLMILNGLLDVVLTATT